MKIGAAILVLLLLAPAHGCGKTVRPRAEAAQAAFPFAEWNAMLERYVDEQGRVDYQAIDRSELERLYAAVAASSPKNHPEQYPTIAAREAYYLDAYNVLVWKNVVDRLPHPKRIDDVKTNFFYLTKFVVGGEAINLYHLENEVIRPTFKDPRVHMALNCASGGCPALPREAFAPERLDQQLDREARKFSNEARDVSYDPKTGVVRLSSIFDWYREDFGHVIEWINRYRAADAKIPMEAHIVYIPYDWHLNDGSLVRSP